MGHRTDPVNQGNDLAGEDKDAPSPVPVMHQSSSHESISSID